MQFSESWLREWVNPDVSTQELADQLSMAGLEVEAIAKAAPEFSGVVVGHVLTREKHPDADKLSVCTVDIGAAEPSQIVCGAQNVRAGLKVPVATIGAVLPGDFRIKAAKLRGVASSGMICSAKELGLAESSDGIMPLDTDAPIGKDFREYLALDDALIEVNLTPDRGDCLSIRGLAREVGVINKEVVKEVEVSSITSCIEDKISVEVISPEGCPAYLCRVVRGINPEAKTPTWMKEKLRRCGIRPIHPVVDVTNYVMLELGQPMHGFDLSQIQGGIRVRLAEPGEQMTLLDGNQIKVLPGTLLIADHLKPLAMAGIMGGEGSGVTDQTKDVLLESAFFAPRQIAGKARAHGLYTDSSHRYERGVDYELQRQALERATALLMSIAGGQPGPVVEQISAGHLPQAQAIGLRRERISAILGIQVADEQVEDMLTRLGMKVEPGPGGWTVVAPSARFDIGIEVDLIEEVGRIYGYANIPANVSAAPVSLTGWPESRYRLDRAKQVLVARGFQEVITYSFISPDMAKLLSPEDEPIILANPISAELSVMRASLWPGLLTTLTYNLARQADRGKLFESGLTFRKIDGQLVQSPSIAGLIYGSLVPEQWGEKTRKADFYDAKADVEALLAQVSPKGTYQFVAGQDPVLHPGQTAAILRDGQEIGHLGLLHPAIQAKLDIPGNVFVFQITLEAVAEGELPHFAPVSRYPSIRRDLALIAKRDMAFSQVEACVLAASAEIVRDIHIFDVYTGENLEPGTKSLALSLILQDSSHTLTDQEVEQAVASILSALEQQLAIKLREQ